MMKILNLIFWIFSILDIVIALAYFTVQVSAGIPFFIAAIVINPILHKLIQENIKHLNPLIYFLVAFVFIIFGFAVAPVIENEDSEQIVTEEDVETASIPTNEDVKSTTDSSNTINNSVDSTEEATPDNNSGEEGIVLYEPCKNINSFLVRYNEKVITDYAITSDNVGISDASISSAKYHAQAYFGTMYANIFSSSGTGQISVDLSGNTNLVDARAELEGICLAIEDELSDDELENIYQILLDGKYTNNYQGYKIGKLNIYGYTKTSDGTNGYVEWNIIGEDLDWLD